MAGATSPSLALAVLVLLPFDVITWVLRFYVRLSRKAWGPDDWSMVVAIVSELSDENRDKALKKTQPLFIISTIGMLGIAFTGGGKKDAELSTEQRETAMFWWFIMQTMFCLATIPVKWTICFTLVRIADNRRGYQLAIYAIMAAVATVMASTTIYEFFHCTPIQMNWKAIPGGSCKAPSNITGFSFALSAVSIFSDWFCALIPIPLLWHVQINIRVKISIVALLGLGIFASTAAIVRLTVTLNLSATTDFLYFAMPVAAWAHAELGLGVILANLPALRPLVEKVFSLRSTLRSSGKRTIDPTSGDHYHELEEGAKSRKSKVKRTLASNKGTETRIYGSDLADSNSTLDDDRSTKYIVRDERMITPTGIQVDRRVPVDHEDAVQR